MITPTVQSAGRHRSCSRPLSRSQASTRVPARAESVLRVAMTAGDIPDWTGQPDQGFEGYRFVGWSLYDALINWDLSRSDREAGLTPGLATKWTIDPADNKRWIIELRKGVKFHDGCDLNADLVVWNIQRLDRRQDAGLPPRALRPPPRAHGQRRPRREGR